MFETPPVGGPDGQGTFLNSVGIIDSSYSATALLALLQTVEKQLGRVRERRWDQRSVDLDIILYQDCVASLTAGLELPHPRFAARSFVMTPAIDIAAGWIDPRSGWSLGEIHEHLQGCTPSIALDGLEESLRTRLCKRLAQEHNVQITGNSTNGTDSVLIDWERPWIASAVSESDRRRLIFSNSHDSQLPRLIAQLGEGARRRGGQHQTLSDWKWPQYSLKVEDEDWAVSELAAALQSMQCPLRPVTENGDWF